MPEGFVVLIIFFSYLLNTSKKNLKKSNYNDLPVCFSYVTFRSVFA